MRIQKLEDKLIQLKKANEELRQKLLCSERLAAIGKLSSSIAHELRQPLSVISNAIYYLKMTLPEANETS